MKTLKTNQQNVLCSSELHDLDVFSSRLTDQQQPSVWRLMIDMVSVCLLHGLGPSAERSHCFTERSFKQFEQPGV